MKIYLIGSLKNNSIPLIANRLREVGFEVFDDWWSGGYEADDKWQEHEKIRGRNYKEALYGHHADDIFHFDLTHLKSSDLVVMVMPCGKSGHLELGWFLGTGRPGYVLFDKDPDRYDIMYRFANDVYFDLEELIEHLNERFHEVV